MIHYKDQAELLTVFNGTHDAASAVSGIQSEFNIEAQKKQRVDNSFHYRDSNSNCFHNTLVIFSNQSAIKSQK